MRKLNFRAGLYAIRMRCAAKYCRLSQAYDVAMRISEQVSVLLVPGLRRQVYMYVRDDVLGKWYLAIVKRGLE